MATSRCRRWGLLLLTMSVPIVGCELFQPTPAPTATGPKPGPSASASAPEPVTGPLANNRPVQPEIDQYINRIQDALDRGAASPAAPAGAQRSERPSTPPSRPAPRPLAQSSPSAAGVKPQARRAQRVRPVEVPLGGASSVDRLEAPRPVAPGSVRLASDEVAVPVSRGAPPRVETVRVAPEADRSEAASPARASRAQVGVNMSVETAQIPTSLRSFLDRYLSSRDDGTFREQVDERILRVLAGDPDVARRPLKLVSTEQQELAEGILEALIAVRASHQGDPGAMADAALPRLEQLASTLRTMSDLKIPTVVLCWKVEGFGRYEAFAPAHFVAGQESSLIVYSEVEGFSTEQREDGLYYSEFGLTTRIVNRIGDVVAEFREEQIVDKCRNRRRDCFIPHLVHLPAMLGPGDYVAKVSLIDKLGEKVAENRATFKIVTGL